MYNRIYSFLDTNGSIFKSQYGFRKRHSCEHAITELIGEICKNLENEKHTLALFIDLSKAFDIISHEILYKKLERYGIRGTALNWFISYLEDCKIRAKCQCASSSTIHYSEPFEFNIGTPQGSYLGPLICLIFCNVLYLNLQLCRGILFADDTTIYNSSQNVRYLKWSIEHDLGILSDWFKANQLSLNSNKSVGILFSNRSVHIDYIETNELSLEIVDHTKLLGVWIDNKLRWKFHTEKLSQKIIRNINELKLGNKFLNIHSTKLIYFAQIQSHLNYCLSTWGNMISKESLTKLQQLQDKSVELMNGQKAMKNNYKSLGILRLCNLIKLEICKFGYKIMKNILPICISEIKTDHFGKELKKTHGYNTCKKVSLTKPWLLIKLIEVVLFTGEQKI